MTEIQTMRQSMLQQTQIVATKNRFGLFSQPISTAIGDDGPYKTKLHPRDQNGKPVTQLRNIFTSPPKKGQLAYFQKLKSLATGDKKDIFIEEGKRLIKQQYETFNHNRKQFNFVPASGRKSITNSSFPYIQQKNPELDPKRHRQQDGRVKSLTRNFVTNPGSRVIDHYFKPLKHLQDPFDRKHKMQIQKMKADKLKQGQTAFKPNSFAPKVFNEDKEVYAVDIELKKKQIKEPQFNIYKHEAPFKSSSPMKSGLNGYINKFPIYMQNPIKEKTRKQPKTNQKQAFKNMSVTLSKPSPSITYANVRRSFMTHR